MRFSIDRIEEAYAVLQGDDLSVQLLPVNFLPPGAREGSILEFNGDSVLLCTDEEAQRRQRMYELQKRLKKKSDSQ